MENIVKFNNVSIAYGKNSILSNINFEIEKRSFVFLDGKIGSGKTTFLKTIYADFFVDKGQAEVFEYDLRKIKNKEIPYLRRRIGFIFQDFKFLNDRNIYSNLKFVLQATGWSDKEKIKNRIIEVLQEVNMKHKIKSMPYELSGGEIQRISLARAILNSPELILADEPTGNLDEQSAKYVTMKLREQCDKDSSVIFVTHNRSLHKFVSDAIIYKIDNKKLKRF